MDFFLIKLKLCKNRTLEKRRNFEKAFEQNSNFGQYRYRGQNRNFE